MRACVCPRVEIEEERIFFFFERRFYFLAFRDDTISSISITREGGFFDFKEKG